MSEHAIAFRRLADEFRAVEADSVEDGAYYLRLRQAYGGRLVWLALQDGCIPELPIAIEGFPVPYDDDPINLTRWQWVWMSFVMVFGDMFANRFPPGLGVARPTPGDGRIFKARDWKERRRHDAMVADALAEILESESKEKSTKEYRSDLISNHIPDPTGKRNVTQLAIYIFGASAIENPAPDDTKPENLKAKVSRWMKEGTIRANKVDTNSYIVSQKDLDTLRLIECKE